MRKRLLLLYRLFWPALYQRFLILLFRSSKKKKCATDVIVEHIPTHRLDDVETKLRPGPSLPPVNQFRPRRWLPRVPLPTTFQYPVFTAK